MVRPTNEYAVYRGDTFICMGTAKECAEVIGVHYRTIIRSSNKKYIKKANEDSIISVNLGRALDG